MTSMIDRYVAAATDGFPSKDNENVARDVRNALDDLVEARIAEGLTQEQAERSAVEELGNPRLFAEQFRQEPRSLIGPDLFHLWWKTIRVVIAIVVPLFMALAALEHFASDSDNSAKLVGELIGGAFEGLIQGAFWVTLFFAIIQVTGTAKDLENDDPWTPEKLPEVATGRQITIGNVVVSLIGVIGGIFMAIRIREDQLGALSLNKLYDLPAETPVFNPELSSWWGIGFIGLLVFSLLVSIWSFYRGYWTLEVLGINLVDNGLWIVFLIALSQAGDIINPVVTEASSQSENWTITGENSNQIIAGILILIVAWSLFEVVKGHMDYRKQLRQNQM